MALLKYTTLGYPFVYTEGMPGRLAQMGELSHQLAAAAAASVVGLVAVDTFSREDGTSLGTSEAGHTWTIQEGAADAFSISGFKAVSSTTSIAVIDPGLADLEARAVIVRNGGSPALAFRCGATSADRLAVHLDTTAGFLLQKRVGNTLTALQSQAMTFTVGAPYTVKVSAINDVIKGYIWGPGAPRDPLVLNHTLSAGDMTTFGALTGVGFRNTGSATFDDLTVMLPEPVTAAASAITMAALPAGSVIFAAESGGAYTRPSARADLMCLFPGTSNAGSAALTNDAWLQKP